MKQKAQLLSLLLQITLPHRPRPAPSFDHSLSPILGLSAVTPLLQLQPLSSSLPSVCHAPLVPTKI